MENLTMTNLDANNSNNDNNDHLLKVDDNNNNENNDRLPKVDENNNNNDNNPIVDDNNNDNNDPRPIVDDNDSNNQFPVVEGNVNNDNAKRRRTRTAGGKGRKKVEMKKIEKKSSLIVAFSKRRTGLFKKTDNFVKISGKKAAVIAFSPHGKAYSYGYPSVDTVVEAYLRQMKRDESQRREKKPGGEPWWKSSIEGMDKEELKKFKEALIVFRGNLEERLEEMKIREERTRDFLSLIDQNGN